MSGMMDPPPPVFFHSTNIINPPSSPPKIPTPHISPFTLSSDDRSTFAKPVHRPNTPLDFFNLLSTPKSPKLDSESPMRRIHRSFDSERPKVDFFPLPQAPTTPRLLANIREARGKIASFSFRQQPSEFVSGLLADPMSQPTPEGSSSTSLAGDLSHIFTPESSGQFYSPSLTSTQSSNSNRDRVLGIRKDSATGPSPHLGSIPSKVFLPPNPTDVLPFPRAPYSAWDPAHPTSSSRAKWKTLPHRGGMGAKRVWTEDHGGVYRVGWERPVLDLEARLHETMWEVAGESHTFTQFYDGEEPKSILDVSGDRLWEILLMRR